MTYGHMPASSRKLETKTLDYNSEVKIGNKMPKHGSMDIY